RMVNALAALADSAGATFYADPFESSAPEERPAGLFGILKTLVQPRPDLQPVSEAPVQWQAEPLRRESPRRQDSSRNTVTPFAPVMRERAPSLAAENAMSSVNG
ncbi:MAG TPA: hypothetical protein VMD08_02165, partial [Candidatus Baltobacteraceae bacterium]|nr:hypothetical protein [Candidatus Baltobacteraceae bacterium]